MTTYPLVSALDNSPGETFEYLQSFFVVHLLEIAQEQGVVGRHELLEREVGCDVLLTDSGSGTHGTGNFVHGGFIKDGEVLLVHDLLQLSLDDLLELLSTLLDSLEFAIMSESAVGTQNQFDQCPRVACQLSSDLEPLGLRLH